MEGNDVMSITVDGRVIEAARTLAAVDVLREGGIIGDGVVIRIDGGRATHFAPEPAVTFEEGDHPVFRTFRGALHHFRVDGLLWDWGGPAITETEIRAIAAADTAAEVYADGSGNPIRTGSVIDLTTQWPPILRLAMPRPERREVPVVVNGREILLDRPEVTYEDLVRLAYPGKDLTVGGMRALTVTYRRGPPDRPEGSIVSSEAVRVRQGEVFSVTATDKS